MEWTQERVDDLVQSVELLHRDSQVRVEHRDNQVRINALAESVELVAALHRDNEECLKQMMEMSTRLGDIERKYQ